MVKTRLSPRTTACVCPVYKCTWPSMTSWLLPFRYQTHSSWQEKIPQITVHFHLISCIWASYVRNGHSCYHTKSKARFSKNVLSSSVSILLLPIDVLYASLLADWHPGGAAGCVPPLQGCLVSRRLNKPKLGPEYWRPEAIASTRIWILISDC